MYSYTFSLPVIVISLLCLIPWAMFTGFAVLSDALTLWQNRSNPRPGNVVVDDFEAVHEALEDGHTWLTDLGFDPLCIAENSGRGRHTREWLYHHPDVPVMLASLSLGSSERDAVVEFATRFEGLSVVTIYSESDSINIHTANLIINTVESGISPALEYHQTVVEQEMGEHGDPLRLNTPEDYQAWINEFDVVYRENSYFVRQRRWQRVIALFAAVAAVVGLAGLHLMNSIQVTEAGMAVLALLMVITIVLQVRWVLRPPWEKPNVEQRFKQKTAV